MINYEPGIAKKNTSRFVQPKLKIGQAGDKYEQEADAVADRVIRMNQSDTMQMQPIEEEEELLQPKLRMQPVEEKEELLQPKIRMQPEDEEEEEIMTKKVSGYIQKFDNGQSQASHEIINSISTDVGPGIQRLIKSTHPWTGTVVNTPLLALRDAPNGTTLADLPDDTLVNVQGVSGGWLDIEVDTTQSGIILNRRGRSSRSGDILDGFSYHRYIDDAAAAEMTEMLGEQATWVPSGPSSGNSFQTWASAATESAAPPVTSVTTINCWEMVIMAAFRIGAVDWQWIHDLYTNTTGNWYDELPNRMTSGGNTAHDLSTHTPLPVRGDVVFFDGASHVALATGNGDEIITFWPPPNTAFTAGGTVDDVKLSTIQELSDWMTLHMSTPTVTFGSPAW